MMIEASVRRFNITPNQYELFRFAVEYPTTLRIRMIATSPVNLILLNNKECAEYESGRNLTHSYTAAWGRKSDLEASVTVDPGTWYLIVEGSTEPSSGRIEVFQ